MLILWATPKPTKVHLKMGSAEGQLHSQESPQCPQLASGTAELQCPMPMCRSCRITEREEGTNPGTCSQHITCTVQQHDCVTRINKASDFQIVI